jgi:hypothetical protein
VRWTDHLPRGVLPTVVHCVCDLEKPCEWGGHSPRRAAAPCKKKKSSVWKQPKSDKRVEFYSNLLSSEGVWLFTIYVALFLSPKQNLSNSQVPIITLTSSNHKQTSLWCTLISLMQHLVLRPLFGTCYNVLTNYERNIYAVSRNVVRFL